MDSVEDNCANLLRARTIATDYQEEAWKERWKDGRMSGESDNSDDNKKIQLEVEVRQHLPFSLFELESRGTKSTPSHCNHSLTLMRGCIGFREAGPKWAASSTRARTRRHLSIHSSSWTRERCSRARLMSARIRTTSNDSARSLIEGQRSLTHRRPTSIERNLTNSTSVVGPFTFFYDCFLIGWLGCSSSKKMLAPPSLEATIDTASVQQQQQQEQKEKKLQKQQKQRSIKRRKLLQCRDQLKVARQRLPIYPGSSSNAHLARLCWPPLLLCLLCRHRRYCSLLVFVVVVIAACSRLIAEVTNNECIILLGETGSGKTTRNAFCNCCFFFFFLWLWLILDSFQYIHTRAHTHSLFLFDRSTSISPRSWLLTQWYHWHHTATKSCYRYSRSKVLPLSPTHTHCHSRLPAFPFLMVMIPLFDRVAAELGTELGGLVSSKKKTDLSIRVQSSPAPLQ